MPSRTSTPFDEFAEDSWRVNYRSARADVGNLLRGEILAEESTTAPRSSRSPVDPLDQQHADIVLLEALRPFRARLGAIMVKDDFDPLPIFRPSVFDLINSGSSHLCLSRGFARASSASRISALFGAFEGSRSLVRRHRHFQRNIRSAMAYHARHLVRRSRRRPSAFLF